MTPRFESLRRTNRMLFQQGQRFQGNMPLHLRVSLLEACNLRCYMCHLSALPDEKKDSLSKDLMKMDVFKRLAEDAFPYAELVTFGFAGEPTLHPDFPEFLRIAAGYGILVEIWTNGTALHKPKVQQAIVEHADWLVVSMDGADEEMFAHTRDGASLATISESVLAIKEQAAAYSARKRPLHLGAHNTMMKTNIHQLPMLMEKASSLGIERVSSAHIGMFDGNLKEETLFNAMDLSDRYIEEARERAKELDIHTDLPPLFRESGYAKPNPDFKCFYTNFSIVVLCNGDVLPCCHAASRFRLVMGNLKETPLPDIWYGRRYGILRNSFEVKDFSPACKDCADNNPFMDVSRVWELDSFSFRARKYREHTEFVPALRRYEQQLFIEQKQAVMEAAAAEDEYRQLCERIGYIENHVDRAYHCLSHFKDQISNLGWYQRLPSADGNAVSLLRRVNRMLYEQGPQFNGNMPLHLEISVIAGCNIKCRMCNLAHVSDERYRELVDKRMSMKKVYLRIAKEVFPYAESVFFGIGGEPTMHPQFPAMVRIAAEAGLRVSLTTNGLKLRQKEFTEMCVHHIHTLVISMDGATKETFERIRVGANWERLLEGIRRVVALRAQTPGSRLKLAVNFTLMKENIEEFPQMVTLAAELGIDKVMAEHLLITAEELREQSLFLTPDFSDQYMLEAIQRSKELGVEMEVPDLFRMDQLPQDVKPGTVRNIRPAMAEKDIPHCHILSYSTVIMPDGVIMPCSHPEAQYNFKMGHFNKNTFEEVWYGKKYQTLREGVNGALPKPCSYCAMCGRSDGELPVQDLNNEAGFDEFVQSRKTHPKGFITRRLRFMDNLTQRTEEVRRHTANFNEVLHRMRLHQQNLIELIQTHGVLPMLRSEMNWTVHPPQAVEAGGHFSFRVCVKNMGKEIWQPGSSESAGSVMVGGAFYRDGGQTAFMEGWGELPRPLGLFESAEISVTTNVARMAGGTYTLRVDMVKLGTGFFEESGSQPLEAVIEIPQVDETQALWERAARFCTNLWTVTQGTRNGGDIQYPLFAVRANGARLTDLGGNEYLDFIMGWGTATLGYNRSEVRQAVNRVMHSAPTLPFAHPLQVEAAERLQGFLPCAERVLFGKNGSDVLEAGVRIARALTGRDHVFVCGYHGFHDWYAASVAGVKGVTLSDRSLVHPFEFGNMDSLQALINRFGENTACIVMEPCSMAYPPEGYLQAVRDKASRYGIVLIFDEVMSAFRLANGGAQEVYGVQPDLVAVGKGIANGMPLAALAGPRAVMDTAFQIGYGPTFHGEIYSLAACCAALEIYRNEPVCAHLNRIGQRLKDGIESSVKRYESPLTLEGILPRQVLMFHAQSGYSAAELRTYFLQELLRYEIVCAGTLLPGFAHTDGDADYAAQSIDAILAKMQELVNAGRLRDEIHIPLNVLYLGEEEQAAV